MYARRDTADRESQRREPKRFQSENISGADWVDNLNEKCSNYIDTEKIFRPKYSNLGTFYVQNLVVFDLSPQKESSSLHDSQLASSDQLRL
jgi:hypothetical protein